MDAAAYKEYVDSKRLKIGHRVCVTEDMSVRGQDGRYVRAEDGGAVKLFRGQMGRIEKIDTDGNAYIVFEDLKVCHDIHIQEECIETTNAQMVTPMNFYGLQVVQEASV